VTSRFEPFGMVVLEAMQQGIPVIFPESAGVGEVICSGVKINSNDTSGEAEKAIEILSDENKWHTLA